jgi:uncharacterized protein (TIGR02118 family)
MSVTLLALYRHPEGGEEALAAFLRRYGEEHLPLVRRLPGLRALHVERVRRSFGEGDLCLLCRMVFDDREALDVSLASDEMRAAARNLRDVAPGLSTLYVVEPDAALEGHA